MIVRQEVTIVAKNSAIVTPEQWNCGALSLLSLLTVVVCAIIFYLNSYLQYVLYAIN